MLTVRKADIIFFFNIPTVHSTQYPVHILDKPHNPLVNSGAIMSAAILLNVLNPQKSSKDKFDFVTEYMKVCLEEFQSL